MRGNQSSPTKDCKYLNRNSSENRIYKIEFVYSTRNKTVLIKHLCSILPNPYPVSE